MATKAGISPLKPVAAMAASISPRMRFTSSRPI